MSTRRPIISAAPAARHAALYNLLCHVAVQRPDVAAIMAPGREALAFRQLVEQVDHLARMLHGMGIGRGDRIAVVLPNGPEMAITFLATAATAACAPLNPAYRADELSSYLLDLKPTALIVGAQGAEAAEMAAQSQGVPVLTVSLGRADAIQLCSARGAETAAAPRNGMAEPDDVALLLHTSGTTSRPKLVPLTGRNLCASARHIGAALALTADDRCLNVMPLFHIHGLIGALLAPLVAGGSVVVPEAFDPAAFFDWLDLYAPTWYSAVPTMHQALLRTAPARATTMARRPLRFIRSSSAALPRRVMEGLEQAFGAPVIESYGMSEAAHQITSNPLPPGRRKPGSVGLPAGPEVAIMSAAGLALGPGETGEIVMRGPNIMGGYVDNPAANAAAFHAGAAPEERPWFRSGDQGYRDPDGYLFITGRIKELINRGGEKIAPREVDEALLGHPAVAQAVAFALPHPTLGEDVAAAVVLRAPDGATEAELRRHVAALLAPFKVPSRVVIVDEIPKGPTGKVQRIGLATRLGLDMVARDAPLAAPQPGLETTLSGLWSELLGRPIGREDNFFAAGGDSLLAAQLVARVQAALGVVIPLAAVFEQAGTVAGMATAIAALADQGADAERGAITIPARAPVGDAPLSFAQEQLWLATQLETSGTTYHQAPALRLTGALNTRALGRAVTEIVRRHEALRTTVHLVAGRPVQRTGPSVPLLIPLIDLRDIPAADRERQALRLAADEARRPIDLAVGPLARFSLLRLDDEEHLLLAVIHHIVFDGWSFGVFVRELTALYDAFSAGQSSPLPDPPIQYAAYAHWQRERFAEPALRDQLDYWRRRLDGAPELLPLPIDRPRSAPRAVQGARYPVSIPAALHADLEALSRREGVTLFMTVFAAFLALLHGETGQDDIVVGTPVAGRTQAETTDLIGLFINTLAPRIDLSGQPSFRELLRRVRALALEAYAHQDLPLEQLVRALQPRRDPTYSPLFQVLFVFQKAPPSTTASGLRMEPLEIDTGIAKYDLTLSLWERSTGLTGWLEYRTGLFDESTIERLQQRYISLLYQAVSDPAQPIARLCTRVAIPSGPTAAGMGSLLTRPEPARAQGVAPEQVQRRVAEIWREVLDLSTVAPDASFFDLGGYSMLAVRLIERIEQEYGLQLPFSALFAGPTVEDMARALLHNAAVEPMRDCGDGRRMGEDGDVRRVDGTVPPLPLAIRAAGTRPPLYFVHGDFYLGGYYCFELAARMADDQPFYVLPQHGPDGRAVPATIEAMAADHVASLLAFQPSGPYLLGGMCNGGLIAFEMARQLEAHGHAVALVVVIDAEARRSDDGAEPSVGAVAPLEAPGPGDTEAAHRTYVQAMAAYRPRPYPGRVAVLWPREDPVAVPDDPTLGWGAVAGDVVVRMVPGSHASCMAEFVQDLAAALQQCLDQTP